MDIKELARFMSSKEIFSWVNSADNETEKRRRIEAAKQKFLAQSNFSSATANFSADIADFGSFDGIYDGEDVAEYAAKAKEVAAMSDIRRLTLAHSIKANLKEWILKKNNITKRNRAAKLEAQKAFGNRA